MACKIVWTQTAKEQRKQTLSYGAEKWGREVALKFRETLLKETARLSNYPNIGKTEPLLEKYLYGYRSIVINKHFKLVYCIDDKKDILYIVALWDTRREPAALAQSITNK